MAFIPRTIDEKRKHYMCRDHLLKYIPDTLSAGLPDTCYDADESGCYGHCSMFVGSVPIWEAKIKYCVFLEEHINHYPPKRLCTVFDWNKKLLEII